MTQTENVIRIIAGVVTGLVVIVVIFFVSGPPSETPERVAVQAEQTSETSPGVSAVQSGQVDSTTQADAPSPSEPDSEETSPGDANGQDVSDAAPERVATTDVATSEDEPEPQAPVAAPSAVPDANEPSIDLVRIEADGTGLVAGRAEPGTTLAITLDGETLQEVTAGADGGFAAFLTLPDMAQPGPMRVQTTGAGPSSFSEQTVLIVPPKRGSQSQPTIVVADAAGATLVQPSEPEAAPSVTVTTDQPTTTAAPVRQNLTLDTISYDEIGEVVLSGRASGDQFVRIYVDNEPVQTGPVGLDGNWRVTLPDVKVGTYTLRVDQISPAGKVVSRVESPFQRVSRDQVAASVDRPATVTVQPGNSLWVLAEERYGDGIRYVQIFEANRESIRNADLIYPGQIFDLPDLE